MRLSKARRLKEKHFQRGNNHRKKKTRKLRNKLTERLNNLEIYARQLSGLAAEYREQIEEIQRRAGSLITIEQRINNIQADIRKINIKMIKEG